jgi:hypothetical protein
MTAAAIATTATVEAATITRVFYPAARAGNLAAAVGDGGVRAAPEAAFVRTRPTLRGAFTVGSSPFKQHTCDRPKPTATVWRRSGFAVRARLGPRSRVEGHFKLMAGPCRR